MNYSEQKNMEIAGMKFSHMDLFDLVCTALNGGISYWAGVDNGTDEWKNITGDGLEEKFFNILLNGGKVKLYDDSEEQYEDEDFPWFITLESLKDGIRITIEEEEWDGDVDEHDAETADCIFQNAIFGELVFG